MILKMYIVVNFEDAEWMVLWNSMKGSSEVVFLFHFTICLALTRVCMFTRVCVFMIIH